MDDLFTFFLIFIFFVLPVLERVLRGPKKKPPPPGRTPQRRPQARPAPSSRPLPGRRVPAPVDRESERGAEELVPDDLWAILTGERRPPPARTPPPPERYEPEAPPGPWEDARVEVDTREELAAERRQADRQLEDLLRHRRREGETLPVAVSLETEPLSDRRRHERFHDRVDALAAPASIHRRAVALPSLRDPDQLKRAFVLQEVLGRPKGLE